MKKIKCNCGNLVVAKEKQTFLFDGLQINCRKCGLNVCGSGYGYDQAAEEIILKLKELKKCKLKK